MFIGGSIAVSDLTAPALLEVSPLQNNKIKLRMLPVTLCGSKSVVDRKQFVGVFETV